MMDRNRLIEALKAADAAGDTEAATKLAQALRASETAPEPVTGRVESQYKPTASDMTLRGWTLGASDYPIAAMQWGIDKAADAITGDDSPMTFEGSLRDVRKGVENFREDHPIAANAAEITGGITSPLMFARAPGSVTAMVERMLDKSATMIGRNIPNWMRVGVHGGVDAGLYGGITAQNEHGGVPSVGDVASSAAIDGGLGMGLGIATKPVIGGVGWAGRKVADTFQAGIDKLPFNQETGAAREFAKTLNRAGIDEQQLMANRARLGPRSNVLDAAGYQDPETGVWLGGRGVYQQTDMLANSPGKTPDLAERVMKPRPSQGATDLLTSVRRDISPREFQQTFDSISDEMQTAASPLYKEAFAANKSVSSPLINRILTTPAGKEAMGYALERTQNRMSRMAVPDKELTEQMRELAEAGKMDPVKGGVASGLKLQTLDLIKQALGQQEQVLKRRVIAGTAKKGELDDITDLRRDFTAELDRLDVTAKAGPNSVRPEGGKYKQARGKWADGAALQEALEAGEQFMRGERDIVVKDFRALTQGEKDIYFVGMAKAIQNAVEQTGTVPARLKNILNKENGARKTLQAILPPDKFNSFLNTVASISRKSESARMLGGSPTAPRQEYAADIGADLGGAAIEGAKGNLGNAAVGVARSAMNLLRRPSEGMRDELGRLLLDPDAFPDALNALRSRAQINRSPRAFGTLQAGSGQNLLRALPLGIR